MKEQICRAWNFNKEFNKSRVGNFYCNRIKDLEFEKGNNIKIKRVKFSPSNDCYNYNVIYIYYRKSQKKQEYKQKIK